MKSPSALWRRHRPASRFSTSEITQSIIGAWKVLWSKNGVSASSKADDAPQDPFRSPRKKLPQESERVHRRRVSPPSRQSGRGLLTPSPQGAHLNDDRSGARAPGKNGGC